MKIGSILAKTSFILILTITSASGLPPIDGKVLGFYPITNEISFYKNVDDSGNNRGQTLQLISINNFKLYTEFTFEFTGDFNWDMSNERRDHYIELSLVKKLAGPISVNYQRIYSTFETEPINQFGLRLSL